MNPYRESALISLDVLFVGISLISITKNFYGQVRLEWVVSQS